MHELEHRVAAALRARTFAELEQTTDDLPGGSSRRRPAARVALRTVRVHPVLLLILIPLAVAAAATVVAVSLLWCALALLVMMLGHRRRPPRLPWGHTGPWMIRSAHWRSDRGPWL